LSIIICEILSEEFHTNEMLVVPLMQSKICYPSDAIAISLEMARTSKFSINGITSNSAYSL